MEDVLNDSIRALLRDADEPLNLAYISLRIQDYSLSEVFERLESLAEAGLIDKDYFGYSIRQSSCGSQGSLSGADANESDAFANQGTSLSQPIADMAAGDAGQAPADSCPAFLDEAGCSEIIGAEDLDSILRRAETRSKEYCGHQLLSEEAVLNEIRAESSLQITRGTAGAIEDDPWHSDDSDLRNECGKLAFGWEEVPCQELPAGLRQRAEEEAWTFASLVAKLDELDVDPEVSPTQLSNVEKMLQRYSGPIDCAKDDARVILALSSGSGKFVFDAFDSLRVLIRPVDWGIEGVDFEPKVYANAERITRCGVSAATSARLKRAGIRTVGDYRATPEHALPESRKTSASDIGQLRRLRDYPQKWEKGCAAHPLYSGCEIASHAKALGEALGACVAMGIDRALQKCIELDLPVNAEAFFAATAITLLQEDSSIRDEEETLSYVMTQIEGSKVLHQACLRSMTKAIDESWDGVCLNEGSVVPYSVPATPIWESVAKQYAAEGGKCRFRNNEGRLEALPFDLQAWVDVLGEQDRAIIKARLNGKTLEETGAECGLTRERVRQICKSLLEQRPPLEEDRLLWLVSEYKVDLTEFLAVVGCGAQVFNYLKMARSSSGKKPLMSAINDCRASDSMRSALQSIADSGFIYEDGYRIKADKQEVLAFVIKRVAEGRYVTVDKLAKSYNQFLADHKLAGPDFRAIENQHNFEEQLKRRDDVLCLPHKVMKVEGAGGYIRYYPADTYDFADLEDAVIRLSFWDVEISVALLFDDEGFRPLLEEYDIRNAYELHYILNNFCSPIEGIKFGKNPMITLGRASRDEQVMMLVRRLSPVSQADLARHYSKRFGVDESTVKANYLKCATFCERNGKYVYTEEGLSDEQMRFLRRELVGDYVPSDLIKIRFEDKFPGESSALINETDVGKLGYVPHDELFVREGLDLRKVFGNLIDSKRGFSLDEQCLGRAVANDSDFKAELSMRVRAMRFIEYEPRSYMATSVLSELDPPVSEDDLRSYVSCALEYAEADVPFTVESLRKAGFSHPLDTLRETLGVGDFFYASLLSTATSGGRIKRTTVANHPIFCITNFGFSTADLIAFVVARGENFEIEELCDVLADEYGIRLTPANARANVERSGLYYSKALDEVFIDEGTYKRKAKEWIS